MKRVETALQRVTFAGAYLEALEHDGKVWAVVKRVCENPGIDTQAQQRKLTSTPWAGTAIIAVPSRGGDQETFCVDLDSLPMWLATTHVSKVRADVRERLVVYQREARQVLADHFFGRTGAMTAQPAMLQLQRAFDRLADLEASRQEDRTNLLLMKQEQLGTRQQIGDLASITRHAQEDARVLQRVVHGLTDRMAVGHQDGRFGEQQAARVTSLIGDVAAGRGVAWQAVNCEVRKLHGIPQGGAGRIRPLRETKAAPDKDFGAQNRPLRPKPGQHPAGAALGARGGGQARAGPDLAGERNPPPRNGGGQTGLW